MTTADHPATGLSIEPFRALRFTASGDGLARRLSPPYDVIDAAGVADLERADPYNVVRLILPRDDAPAAQDRYQRAATTLAAWRDAGVLAQDDAAGLYVYEMSYRGHDADLRTRGLLAAVELSPPDAGVILPHENTMAGPVADRLALTQATEANLEAIYLVYDGGGSTAAMVAGVVAAAPIAEATTADGVTHRLWALTDHETVAVVRADLSTRRAVIADGHHRYATYLRYQAYRRDRGDGSGPWDRGLAFLVDARTAEPQVEAIHRVIASLPLATAVARARDGFSVTAVDGPLDAALDRLRSAGQDGTAFLLTDGAQWYLVHAPDPRELEAAVPSDHAEAWRGLDVTVAHRLLIGRLWGLRDTEDVVDFEHDPPVAVARAAAAGGTALLLNPTPVADVAAVATAGERMPRKSTLFTPKPATGLVIRPLR